MSICSFIVKSDHIFFFFDNILIEKERLVSFIFGFV